MVTQAKVGIFKPKVLTASVGEDLEPTIVTKALSNVKWKQAMEKEFDALIKNKHWTLISPPSDRKRIGCKWIFRVKRNVDGFVAWYKTRLMAKGYNQLVGFDLTETFSLVVKPVTIHVVLTMALLH